MKSKSFFDKTLIILLLTIMVSAACANGPSNPNATPEARALLDLFYRISGRYTLSGQHNYPNTRDHNTLFAAEYTGQTPAIWSTDMGFAKAGDYDSYLARADIVKEAIRQHRKGSIITICWHAVPPTADEPVTFQPQGKVSPDSLASVQGKLPDEQFRDVLTPGTRLYKRWAAQVDSVAVYLKKLQDARVPVLWRPYHEMNGDWFWWGGRVGEYSTADLYRQIYDRLVNYHKLNNLVWVWSVDRPSTPVRKFSNFYPGNDYLDILALDVYGSDFNQAYYDSLMALSKGKPIVLGEVGNPPTPVVLEKQPNWAYWVIWAGMVRNLSKKQHHVLIDDPRILSQEDKAFQDVMAPFRKACGLPPLPLKNKYPLNFSGDWIFNEDMSDVGNGGTANIPYQMVIHQDNDKVYVKRFISVEWGPDRVTDEDLYLDGTVTESESLNAPRFTEASWDDSSKSVKIQNTVRFNRGGRSFDMKSSEEWSLRNDGHTLQIIETSTGFRSGESKITLIYEKQ
jgi:mannan endo-1,4-beta-mannosidase